MDTHDSLILNFLSKNRRVIVASFSVSFLAEDATFFPALEGFTCSVKLGFWILQNWHLAADSSRI